jgi:ribosomal protein S18 acetylase RimI-like enzyme
MWEKLDPVEHAWAIQDMELWPDRSRLFTSGTSYLLFTGHPSQGGGNTLILGDDSGELAPLLAHLPETFVIRETRASVLPKLQPYLKGAKVYLEQRMEVTRESFLPRSSGRVRKIGEADAAALAAFFGAPPQAAPKFLGWIRGGLILAAMEENQILALGTVIVRTKDAWVLASVETKEAHRGKGLAKEVVSALVGAGLEKARAVSLTVKKDNAPAIRAYESLGFKAKEDRIWVDQGVGAAP